MRNATLALLAGLACLVGPWSSATSNAESFPTRPIRLIVPFGPGGPTDIVARSLAQEASGSLKSNIVVINKPGASATIGTADVFGAKPDGYTILLGDNISTAFQPQRMQLQYKGPKDFQPIVKIADIPNMLVVRRDAKWQTLDEFVADARAKPGSIRVSTAGKFTGTDLNMLELNQIAHMETTTVPVSGGTGESVSLLLSKQVEAIVAAPAAIVGFVRSKDLRPLAVFAKQRIKLFPDVPTTTELGYKTTMGVTVFLSAPKGLKPQVLDKLRVTFTDAINSPHFREFANKNGYLVDPLGPAALGDELAGWQRYFVTLSHELGLNTQ